ncbi:MAG TPA: hypothetical protein VF297_20595 [Pyrinomonadaceae bacterium]
MPKRSLERWLLLRFKLTGTTLWVTYEDDEGVRRDPPPKSGTAAAAGWSPPVFSIDLPANYSLRPLAVRWPSDLGELVQQAISSLPQSRYGGYSAERAAEGQLPQEQVPPLPIFVEPPASNPGYAWEDIAKEMLRFLNVELERVEFVRLARRKWAERPPFRLPLRVLGVGVSGLAALQGIRSAPWYQNAETRAYGLHIDFADPLEIAKELRKEARDIVVVDQDFIEETLDAIGKLGRKFVGPRLVIFLDNNPNLLYVTGFKLPPGMSLLWVPLEPHDDSISFIKDFILGIIHDQPLHEAAKVANARMRPGLTYPEALLFADPRSNQELRMSEAFAELRDEAAKLDLSTAVVDIESFIERLPPEQQEGELGRLLKLAAGQRDLASPFIDGARSLSVNFKRETWGLKPLAEMMARLATARNASNVIAQLAAAMNDPVLFNILRNAQRRSVEVVLDYLDEESAYRPFSRYQELEPGARYRLGVYVGHRMENSLLTGVPPPLDPLLPEVEGQEGHDLQVVVYEKSFTLHTPRVRTLHLPPLGGSAPVHFELTAPLEPGPAELRIVIYYKNHLLQSFLFEGEIGPTATPNSRPVRVGLEYTRTERFTNLEVLKGRELSIGLNQNPDGRTHSLFLYKDEVAAQPITLDNLAVRNLLDKFRLILEEATYYTDSLGDKVERFTDGSKPGTPEWEVFETTVRGLADLGRDHYLNFISNPAKGEMEKKLDEVKRSAGKTIQVTRHDQNLAFPWAIMYDYRLPTKVTGAAPAPLCLGQPFADAPATPPRLARGCPHNPHRETYCIQGFWGVRHSIEQIIDKEGTDVVNEVEIPPQRKGICLATSIDDASATGLATELQDAIKDSVVELTPDDDIYTMLWDSGQRPAVLIVLGHLERNDLMGEPSGPRIMLFPRAKWTKAEAIPESGWLRDVEISDWKSQYHRWDAQPLPLVLLLGCATHAVELGAVNDLVKAFSYAGAGAVVGTECTTFSSLAARFAREVTEKVWVEKRTLGQAVLDFNQALITSGNPLGFVFSCFGNVDLKLVPLN